MTEPVVPPALSRLGRLYYHVVLRGPMPALWVMAILATTVFFSFFLKDFQMDASTDSIVLEQDRDLRYYNRSRQLFGTDDYVVVIVSADAAEKIVADECLGLLKDLCAGIETIKNVESHMSILDVPLFHSPNVPLMQATKNYKTLLTDADRGLALTELRESPLYSDYIISKDGKTTAIQVNFDPDQEFVKLSGKRQELLNKKLNGEISRDERRELKRLTTDYDNRHAELSEARRQDIARLREIIAECEAKYPAFGKIHIAGVPMMIADMINYIEHDLWLFGISALLFMMITLTFIYRKPVWVGLPIAACLITTLIMIGLMSMQHWRTTVVTANFGSLLLILTLATAVHIVSHFRELLAEGSGKTARELTAVTVDHIFRPCFYMILTTMAGFASLMLSGIRPVMDFGQLMAAGLGLSYCVCFMFIPPALVLLHRGAEGQEKRTEPQADSNMLKLAVFTKNHPTWVAVLTLGFGVFFLVGISKISIEARFIDYFRSSTPIHESISLLDSRMGGAMPLEVVLEGEGKDYWLEPENLDTLAKVHDFIDSLPETAKVISAETMRRILVKVNNGRPVNKAVISMAVTSLPRKYYRYIAEPYVTPEFDQARLVIRVLDSKRDLYRSNVRERIETFLNDEIKYPVGTKSHVTGYFILYNNMLQSLYLSQIKTIGSVFLIVGLMFAFLFRSIRLAAIGLVPNMMAVALILGTMGWLGIHLDMMTVMIAAITFGMADDNTIHYLHRFGEEFAVDRNYTEAMYRVHNSIGRPLSYTMLTTVVGFLILGFSNFIPTVYFGLFVGLAMFAALIAVHTILPMLILIIKPFGREHDHV